MGLFNELQNQMIKFRFRANKKFAQHFMVNEKILEKLVELAELKKSDSVLEIGAGTGFLTRELLKHSRVVAVELDEILCRVLEEELPKKNLKLICGDFLKAEIPKFNKVVSLPPYSQSAAIVYKLLERDFELGVIVFQKEFAEKLVAMPGFEEYCALSVLTQFSFEASLVKNVSSGCFFPKPKDESSIVLLKAHSDFDEVKDKALFAFFLKTLFRFKNKNLKNALAKSRQFLLPKLGLEKGAFDKKIASLPYLDEKINLLPVEAFVETFNTLAN